MATTPTAPNPTIVFPDTTRRDRAATVEALVADVEYLCSDTCLPRLPGTPGGDAARAFVERRFDDIALLSAGENRYRQPIPGIGGANAIAYLPGGPTDRVIVIGAHFDACAIDRGINVGASDNAASVAIMLEVARRLAEDDPAGRGVLFLALDAEEPPYFQGPTMGSRYFVAHPTGAPLEAIDLMICLDMVGHRIGDGSDPDVASTIVAFGAEKSREASAALEATPAVDGLTVRRLDVDLIGHVSDHAAFQDAGIPILFYNALRNEHYHAPTDTPDTLDYDKMAALVEHLVGLIRVAKHVDGAFSFDADGCDPASSIETLGVLASTLPPASRLAARVPGLLETLAGRDPAALTTGDRQTMRRILLEIEEGLGDTRLWDHHIGSTAGAGAAESDVAS